MQIIKDEYWPWYILEEDNDYRFGRAVVDIPKDKLDWIYKTTLEFHKVNEYLGDLYENEEKYK